MIPPEVPKTVRKTALNAVHRQMGAKMVEFNGWDMPVEYPASIGCGIVNEHMAVRTGVGLFDVSHMGDIRLAGPGALDAVQHISMNDASKLAIGQAQYSALLYPEGTFVDDVIVHRLGVDEYLLVINAGTREKDFSWVRDNTRQFDCLVENLSDDYTQIAIQGPKAIDLMEKLNGNYIDVPDKGLNSPFQKLRIDADYKSLKFYWITEGRTMAVRTGADRLFDSKTLIGRTGYTAEDGFEIYIPSDEADQRARLVWIVGGWQGIWSCALRPGRAQHAAARRQTAALRP